MKDNEEETINENISITEQNNQDYAHSPDNSISSDEPNDSCISLTEELKKNIEKNSQLNQELKKTQTLLNEKETDYLRLRADWDNWKKRFLDEQKKQKEYMYEDILLNILSLLDNFERAILGSQKNEDFKSLYEGVLLSEKDFKNILTHQYQLNSFGEIDDPFDPHLHEAISCEEDKEELKIKEIVQKGYMYKDKVLRTAKVRL